MFRKFLFLTLAACFGFSVCHLTVLAQPRKPKTVKTKTVAPRTVTDFYMRLPAKYFPYVEDVKNRRDLIEGENLEDGYLSFMGNRAFMPPHAEMLLLSKMGNLPIPLLVVSYTDCNFDSCKAVLHLLEYHNGRWSEFDGTPPFEIKEMREIYRRKTGRDAGAKPYITYELNSSNKHLTVKMKGDDGADMNIYELEWDGNIYDFATPQE
jgi:hypothetical protein